MDTVEVTVLYRRYAARHRHVFIMATVVKIPASVSTVSYRSLVADTVHVVQHDMPGARPEPIYYHSSFVTEINILYMVNNSACKNRRYIISDGQ